MNQVKLSKNAEKQLRKVPDFIAGSLQKWIGLVEMFGITKNSKDTRLSRQTPAWRKAGPKINQIVKGI